MDQKIAVVTGGTSGIGRETALALLKQGCKVYIISRRPTDIPGLIHITGDVSDEARIREVINMVLVRESRIDILVNCAGMGISGAIEFTEYAAARKQIDVNFFGTVNTTKAVLGAMRERKSGRIVNISSVAAPAAIPFQAFYSASKAAINDYTAALANEVRSFGISVSAVMPGDTCTGFTAARQESEVGEAEYGGSIQRSVSKMAKDEKNGMSAKQAGAYVAKIALQKKGKPLYAIGFTNKLICVLLKLLPCRFSNYLIGKLYIL